MKILFLATDVFFKGGVQRYSRYQADALREIAGKENVFVLSLHPAHPGTPDAGDSSDFEEPFAVDYAGGGTSLMAKVRFAHRAFVFARDERPDLVMCNHVALAPIAAFIKKSLGIKYAVNVYGLEIWSGLTRGKLRALRAADRVIGDCHFILEYISRYQIMAEQTALLYDCVDTERFAPLAAGGGADDGFSLSADLRVRYHLPSAAENKKMIVTVGRLDRDKGHAAIIKALRELPRDVVYIIVGGGTGRDALEQLAAAEGVGARVIFTGRVPEADLPLFYNAATVVALISRFDAHEGEGLPLGLIEASACGAPILAGNEDGSVDAVVEGRNGIVISPRDPAAIVSALRRILEHPAEAERMGREGRQVTLELFSYNVFLERLRQIVHGLA